MSIPWYQPLLQSVEVKRRLFWHSSPLNATEDFIQDLNNSNLGNHEIKIIDCLKLPILPSHDLDASSIRRMEADILIVTNFDVLLSLTHGKTWMRQLRPVMGLFAVCGELSSCR